VFSKILSSIGFATISNSETISSEGTMISMLSKFFLFIEPNTVPSPSNPLKTASNYFII